ncbi:VWA domain-containing protein [Mycobacterium angelicum]|uniref:VWA domain-containing protein n=1 Tax=Mycobacterium angelicum TaxID=470074 RepID=UPI00111C28E9|nr:VWA domain-containing protein [Mycobacterium angelicum]MCV7197272.1 VWA domain-containing protein [Mycobacterium angelicum]
MIVGVVLVLIRMIALYRVLLRTASGRYRVVVARWSGLTLAVILLLLAACRPGFDSDQAGPSVDVNPVARVDPNVNVFFVVDRSVNSRVEDFGKGKSRMSGIRSDLGALIDEYPHARFAVISYAGKASMDWPLSDDTSSLRSIVKGLSPYTLVAPDAMYHANAAAARNILRDKVVEAAKTFPDSKTLVFYFGEGAARSHIPAASFDIGPAKVAGGAVLGYGTSAGGPIPQGWLDGEMVYQGDPDGNGPLTSTIDEDRLKAIAGQLNVPYFHRESGQPISGVAPAVDQTADMQRRGDRLVGQFIERHEWYWLFTLFAAALLLAEIGLTIREYRRNRMSRRDLGR